MIIRRQPLYFALRIGLAAILVGCGDDDLVRRGTGSARVTGCFAFQAADLRISRSANDSARRAVFEFTKVVHSSPIYPADSLRFVARGIRGVTDSTQDGHRAHWRPDGDDEIVFAWHDGFWGPVFRLALLGDTLRGSYRIDSDARSAWPEWTHRTRATAVRVPCA
jgi:hypothetical protein